MAGAPVAIILGDDDDLVLNSAGAWVPRFPAEVTGQACNGDPHEALFAVHMPGPAQQVLVPAGPDAHGLGLVQQAFVQAGPDTQGLGPVPLNIVPARPVLAVLPQATVSSAAASSWLAQLGFNFGSAAAIVTVPDDLMEKAPAGFDGDNASFASCGLGANFVAGAVCSQAVPVQQMQDAGAFGSQGSGMNGAQVAPTPGVDFMTQAMYEWPDVAVLGQAQGQFGAAPMFVGPAPSVDPRDLVAQELRDRLRVQEQALLNEQFKLREQQQQHELQVLHQRQTIVEYNAQQKQALLNQQQVHEHSAQELKLRSAQQQVQMRQLYDERVALEELLRESRGQASRDNLAATARAEDTRVLAIGEAQQLALEVQRLTAENCALHDVAALAKVGGVAFSKAEVFSRQFDAFAAIGAAPALARPLQSATETGSYVTLAPLFEPIKETRRVDHPRDAQLSSSFAPPACPPGLGQAPPGGSGGVPRREPQQPCGGSCGHQAGPGPRIW